MQNLKWMKEQKRRVCFYGEKEGEKRIEGIHENMKNYWIKSERRERMQFRMPSVVLINWINNTTKKNAIFKQNKKLITLGKPYKNTTNIIVNFIERKKI